MSKSFYDRVAKAKERHEFIRASSILKKSNSFVKLSGSENLWNPSHTKFNLEMVYLPKLRVAGTRSEISEFLSVNQFSQSEIEQLLNSEIITASNFESRSLITLIDFKMEEGHYLPEGTHSKSISEFYNDEISEIRKASSFKESPGELLSQLSQLWSEDKQAKKTLIQMRKNSIRSLKEKISSLSPNEYLNVTQMDIDGSSAKRIEIKGSSKILRSLAPSYPKVVFNSTKDTEGVKNFCHAIGMTPKQTNSVLENLKKAPLVSH